MSGQSTDSGSLPGQVIIEGHQNSHGMVICHLGQSLRLTEVTAGCVLLANTVSQYLGSPGLEPSSSCS